MHIIVSLVDRLLLISIIVVRMVMSFAISLLCVCMNHQPTVRVFGMQRHRNTESQIKRF